MPKQENPQVVPSPNFAIPLTTTNFLPGTKITKVLGLVVGITVRTRGLGGQIGAGFKGLIGGEIKQYTQNAYLARHEALARLVEHAQSMGADAVVKIYFDSNELQATMDEIIAYGTAVKTVPETLPA